MQLGVDLIRPPAVQPIATEEDFSHIDARSTIMGYRWAREQERTMALPVGDTAGLDNRNLRSM